MPLYREGVVTNPPAGNGTVVAVVASTTAVPLLAANPARKAGTIANNSTATLYIALGVGASSNLYTVALNNGDYFEVPGDFAGLVSGVWSTANGNALVTELT